MLCLLVAVCNSIILHLAACTSITLLNPTPSPPPRPTGPDLPLLSALEAFQGGALLEQAPATPQDAPPGWRVLGEDGARGLDLFTVANVPHLGSGYHCNPQVAALALSIQPPGPSPHCSLAGCPSFSFPGPSNVWDP